MMPQPTERQPRSFPSVVPQNPVVYFIWPEAHPDAVLKQLLEAITRNVAYLGSSRSPVRVHLTDEPPTPNWFPDATCPTLLRKGHEDIAYR